MESLLGRLPLWGVEIRGFFFDNWMPIILFLVTAIFLYLTAPRAARLRTARLRTAVWIGLFGGLLLWGVYEIRELLFGPWMLLIVWPVIFFCLTARCTDPWRTWVGIYLFWLGLFWGLLWWGPSEILGFLFSSWTPIALFLGTVIFLYVTTRRPGQPWTDPLRTVMVWVLLKIQWISFRLLARLGPWLDRWVVPWHWLHHYLGLPVLVGIREKLRAKNLHDTTSCKALEEAPRTPGPRDFTTRTFDGAFNDLENPRMGMEKTPFGRNIRLKDLPPRSSIKEKLHNPNPRDVSRKLMTRKPGKFEPAKSLNLLAAAWIQFMVHDWFRHENCDASPEDQKEDRTCPDHMIEISLEEHPWPFKGFRLRVPHTKPPSPEEELLIRKPDEPDGPPANGSPIFINYGTHWWDASQLYGDEATQKRLRLGRQHGKLWISEDNMLPLNTEKELDLAGFDKNWWLGLNLMHTLFTLEHNAICDRLREEYPSWSDDDLFARARLINAGLMAKIQTVDWTPAILNHPTVIAGMRGNWWGILGRKLRRNFGRLLGPEDEVFSGIPGSATEHHTAPYAMTEEFVSVYRMHPLMPDDFCFYSAKDGRCIRTRRLEDDQYIEKRRLHEVLGNHVRRIREDVQMADLLYSFGIAHPGEITLGNYPKDLQELETQEGFTPEGKKKEGFRLDLAAVDILRDRERGVPRYNAFRKALGLRRVSSFRKLTERFEDPKVRRGWRKKLKEVYDNIDDVDLMVGLFAENPPRGFGFSDTAFRIFILMASRRLKSDRFFTTDYRPEIYTQLGLDWVENNDMSTVLLRHFPELRSFLGTVDSAFKPWATVEQFKQKQFKENKFPKHECKWCKDN